MAIKTGRLSPDAILSQSGFTEIVPVSYLQDDPDTFDGNWAVTTTNGNSTLLVSFPTPPQTLTGTQTIKVAFRSNGSTESGATVIFSVQENGNLVASSSVQTIPALTGTARSFTFDASLLADPTGASVDVYVNITGSSSGKNRGTIDVGAIEWDYTYDDAGSTGGSGGSTGGGTDTGGDGEGGETSTLDPNMPIPTERFPFNNSAWKRAEAQAIVADLEGSSVMLEVEYAKNATLTSPFTKKSTSATSGTKITVTLDGTTFASGEIIYWRARAVDASNNVSQWSTIFNFTYKPSGLFAPDGTAFMQQGDPNTHVKVIDISQYQEEASVGSGGVNWQSIKDSGVNHVYLRAYGSARGTGGDNMFETFIGEANAVGIKTGGYFYTMPSVPLDLAQARAEADLFIAKLQAGYGVGQYGDLMPIMDLEDNSGVATAGQSVLDLSVEDMLQWANEFRNYFEAQTGRILGLYTGDYFVRDLRNNFNHNDATGQAVAGTSGNIIQDMPLWIQGYTAYDRYKGYVMPSSGGWTKWYMFQWSETGTQAGISGNVDQNLSLPMEWWLQPADATNVTVQDAQTSVDVNWNPNTEVDINSYRIYVNGAIYDQVTDTTYPISKSEFVAGENQIGIEPVDEFGDTSKNITYITFNHTVPTGATPRVTILSVSRTKISDEEGVDRVYIRFNFDRDVLSYTVNVNGVDHTTGIVADNGGGKTIAELSTMTVGDLATKTVQQISIIVAGFEIVAEVDWTELYSQGENRVNIYGKGVDGIWTEYNQEDTAQQSSNDLGTSSLGTETYGG
jgi:GH25 family lysozyme M1 (1,4-beta-N-acetylmuramidase)